MNNMNITIKENMIIIKYVDISDTYCVHAVYEREKLVMCCIAFTLLSNTMGRDTSLMSF